jgi:hypothetical protein
MSRKIMRVPLDFDWPWHKVWSGYLTPDRLLGDKCPDCKNGYSPRAQYLHDLWYGYVPFRPENNGSTPFTWSTGPVWDFAKRNVERSPEYYGAAISMNIGREARRLATLWNGMWSHHLNDGDIAALVEAGRLYDFTHTFTPETRWQPKDPPYMPTAAEVNEWSIRGFGHDSINASVCIKARCEREGARYTCATCDGHGEIEAYPGQRAEAEAWEPENPPTGDGWQMWETVSEGSPVSPVFATAEDLAQWLTTAEGGEMAGPSHQRMTIEQARGFVGAGWAPTGMDVGHGYEDGAHVIGRIEAAK